jgi:hypothetical protein
MRPKIVILTLVIAFGLLGAVAVLKGMAQKHSADSGPTAVATTVPTPNSADTNVSVAMVNANSSNTAADSEAIRAAVIDKELDQIRTLQGEVDGTNNSVIIAALLEKMNNPEEDVRHAVVQALIEINDTNAVPGLQKASDSVKDPHEKVAILDAITYLKAPGILDNVTPEQMTNNYTTAPPGSAPIKTDPRFLRNGRFKGPAAANGQPAPAPAPVAPQSQ